MALKFLVWGALLFAIPGDSIAFEKVPGFRPGLDANVSRWNPLTGRRPWLEPLGHPVSAPTPPPRRAGNASHHPIPEWRPDSPYQWRSDSPNHFPIDTGLGIDVEWYFPKSRTDDKR